jgi:dipeptidyl aminopeptidase/acylaminoacyl peptidase
MYRETIVSAVLGSILATTIMSAQQERAIQPRDCVEVRYLAGGSSSRPIQMNRQATRVAYLVSSPNLATNQNDVELYVRDLPADHTGHPRKILRGNPISELHWLADGKHVTVLWKLRDHAVIEEVDVESGSHQTIARANADIAEYSVDRNADTVVFATEASNHITDAIENASIAARTPEAVARGFRVPFQVEGKSPLPKRTIFISRRRHGARSKPIPIAAYAQFPYRKIAAATYLIGLGLHLSLSPDGKELLTTSVNAADHLPEEWSSSPTVRAILRAGFPGVCLLTLYHLDSGRASLPLNSPDPLSTPLWSADSKSFTVVAESPVASRWEREDVEAKQIGRGKHLFFVDVARGKVELVASHVANTDEQPLSWTEDGSLMVHSSATVISTFVHSEDAWKEVSRIEIPRKSLYRFGSLAGNRSYIIGDYQNTTTPPQLFLYTPGSKAVELLEKLNPQFDNLSIADAENISWKTTEGQTVDGLLLMPIPYRQGTKYPLIIQTHPTSGGFVCDSGESHFPSYIPQLAANAGMMYLIQTYPEDWNEAEWEAHYPPGYPGKQGYGGFQEAASAMDVWDSAVIALSERGLIDPKRVGIEGFSRKGWYVEFILAHAKTKYRAATVTDNVQYSVGEYWLNHTASHLSGYDLLYGGPPYGKTLKNWMDYSISFNLDRIRTPVLMEEMGYGASPTSEYGMLDLMASYEVFTGLNRLRKPVELYFYPNEQHQPDHPQARLATLQRNLDWYRFWLQGRERSPAEDPDQYVRWRALREIQQQNDRREAASSEPSVNTGRDADQPRF